MESEFNLTLDQLWTYAPIVQPWAWPPQRLIICATLNPPQIKAPKQGQMKVIFEAKENSDGKKHAFFKILRCIVFESTGFISRSILS